VSVKVREGSRDLLGESGVEAEPYVVDRAVVLPFDEHLLVASVAGGDDTSCKHLFDGTIGKWERGEWMWSLVVPVVESELVRIEDGMDFPFAREGELVRGACFGLDGAGACVARAELVGGSSLKVGRKEVLGGEEHEVADLEGILETMLVGFGGVLVLCFADLFSFAWRLSRRLACHGRRACRRG
jgi:hypothetical protein